MTKITIKKFEDALKGSGGNQSIVAKKLDVHRSAVNLFINKYPKMRALLDVEAERIIDVAENLIDASITKDKDIDTAKWKLLNSKRGKRRGYGPRVEQELSGNIDNKWEVEIVHTKKDHEETEDDSSLPED